MLQMQKTFLLFLLMSIVLSCRMGGDSPNSRFGSPDYSNINKENKSRDAWQKPGDVIALLGDLSDKAVADIGAGTGYFTFRLALNAEKVVAVEIDPNMIDLIDAFKINLPADVHDKIETRLATPKNANLKSNEVDVIVIINTITYIEDKFMYIRDLYNVLPEGGKIMVVDYKQLTLPFNIEQGSHKIESNALESLYKLVGLQDIVIDNSTLEYQFIAIGTK